MARELGVPGESLHALGRLDVGVSGVVLVATSRAARLVALSARAEGRLAAGATSRSLRVRESPGAAVGMPPSSRPAEGGAAAIRTPAEHRPRMAMSRPPASGRAMVVFEPLTGRSHQIRAHAARAGLPLLGDHLYGGPANLVERTGADGPEPTGSPCTRSGCGSWKSEVARWEVGPPAPSDLWGRRQKLRWVRGGLVLLVSESSCDSDRHPLGALRRAACWR